MELYIIRHAQSYNNALANIQERVADPPLTELGHRQAAKLADYLARGVNVELARANVEMADLTTMRGFGITKLYCSAMYRSLQTTQPVAQALGLQPEVWLDIHEYGGIYLRENDQIVGYPGKTRGEILEEFPDYVLPDEVTDEGWWHGRPEDWPLCHARAIRTAHQLRKWAELTERVAIVSHGGFIDVLLKALLSQLPTRKVFFHHYNTAISRVDFAPEGESLDVLYLNRVDHLSLDMVS